MQPLLCSRSLLISSHQTVRIRSNHYEIEQLIVLRPLCTVSVDPFSGWHVPWKGNSLES
jgi:hypothetical protein